MMIALLFSGCQGVCIPPLKTGEKRKFHVRYPPYVALFEAKKGENKGYPMKKSDLTRLLNLEVLYMVLVRFSCLISLVKIICISIYGTGPPKPTKAKVFFLIHLCYSNLQNRHLEKNIYAEGRSGMQIDFHFYAIYALARATGFELDDAHIIAYSRLS